MGHVHRPVDEDKPHELDQRHSLSFVPPAHPWSEPQLDVREQQQDGGQERAERRHEEEDRQVGQQHRSEDAPKGLPREAAAGSRRRSPPAMARRARGTARWPWP